MDIQVAFLMGNQQKILQNQNFSNNNFFNDNFVLKAPLCHASSNLRLNFSGLEHKNIFLPLSERLARSTKFYETNPNQPSPRRRFFQVDFFYQKNSRIDKKTQDMRKKTQDPRNCLSGRRAAGYLLPLVQTSSLVIVDRYLFRKIRMTLAKSVSCETRGHTTPI